MDKLKSLLELNRHGFNVAPFQFYLEPEREAIRKFFEEKHVHSFGVRCFHVGAEDPHAPFLFNATLDQAFEFCKLQNQKDWGCIVCESYPITDVVLNGEAMSDGRMFTDLTYSYAKQTCRDVAHEAIVLDYVNYDILPGDLQAVWQRIEDLLIFYKHPTVFEFSIFRQPVGLRHDRLIFWETRKGTR